jgi:hypothetical protein
MSVSTSQTSKILEDRIKAKAEYNRQHNLASTNNSEGNPVVAGTMSGSDLVLILSNGNTVTINEVANNEQADHFSLGSSTNIISSNDASLDWNNI